MSQPSEVFKGLPTTMSKVIAQFTMSLDGFIADANDGVWPLLNWYINGDTPISLPGVEMDMPFKTSRASAELLQALWSSLGATVTGRRDFDVSQAWGGRSPFGIPTFIVTHSVPQEWAGADSPFTFVTAGVASAIEQAKHVVGDKHIALSGSKITQQALQAELVDEIQIDLVPLLLGHGIRLFDNPGAKPIELQTIKVVEAPNVTHLLFRVVK
jgi:dihydrofolate reductase